MSDNESTLAETTAAAPTVASIMKLVNQYALARIIRNASTPTRRSADSETIQGWHATDSATCDRIEAEIREALRAAGIDER